ncbi:hypothetical protein BG015_004044 [Linnemannia schmuckeri]|uniref:Uncharacterized protein n=1 Tax=Linnemannia schmuckeri TaxID=64567 RepID=A0A9P5V1R0_9FUNG|nr:hypothetical protein BG015_004044 [Linnemannia schmuckeri]
MSASLTANPAAGEHHKLTITQPPVVNGQTTILKAVPTRVLSRFSIVNTFSLSKERVDPKKQFKTVPHVLDRYCAKYLHRFVFDWCDDCEPCLFCCPDCIPLAHTLPGLHNAEEPPSYG